MTVSDIGRSNRMHLTCISRIPRCGQITLCLSYPVLIIVAKNQSVLSKFLPSPREAIIALTLFVIALFSFTFFPIHICNDAFPHCPVFDHVLFYSYLLWRYSYLQWRSSSLPCFRSHSFIFIFAMTLFLIALFSFTFFHIYICNDALPHCPVFVHILSYLYLQWRSSSLPCFRSHSFIFIFAMTLFLIALFSFTFFHIYICNDALPRCPVFVHILSYLCLQWRSSSLPCFRSHSFHIYICNDALPHCPVFVHILSYSYLQWRSSSLPCFRSHSFIFIFAMTLFLIALFSFTFFHIYICNDALPHCPVFVHILSYLYLQWRSSSLPLFSFTFFHIYICNDALPHCPVFVHILSYLYLQWRSSSLPCFRSHSFIFIFAMTLFLIALFSFTFFHIYICNDALPHCPVFVHILSYLYLQWRSSSLPCFRSHSFIFIFAMTLFLIALFSFTFFHIYICNDALPHCPLNEIEIQI